MKIIQLCRRYIPDKGGVESHVAELNQVLLSQGHTVSVITETISTAKDVFTIPAQGKMTGWKYKKAVWSWMWQHRQLFIDTDVVHVHDVFWWVWPLYPLITKKVFITFHGWEGEFPVRWQAKLQRWLANVLSQGSIHMGAWIQEFYWDRPSEVLYGGVNFEPIKVMHSQADSKLKIAFVGRLELENNLESYWLILELLKKRVIPYEMKWVGDGSLRSKCQKYGEVTGMVDDVQKKLFNIDVVFANSYLSIMEAQAAGRIVVATYQHLLKKRYLETYPLQTGLIVNDNLQKIVAELQDLKNNPERVTRIVAHNHSQLQAFTWQAVAQVYLKLWQKRVL